MDNNFKVIKDPRTGEPKPYTVTATGGKYGNSLRINLPPLCGFKPYQLVVMYQNPDGSLLIVPKRNKDGKIIFSKKRSKKLSRMPSTEEMGFEIIG